METRRVFTVCPDRAQECPSVPIPSIAARPSSQRNICRGKLESFRSTILWYTWETPRGQELCPGPSPRSWRGHCPVSGAGVRHVWFPLMLLIPPRSSPMPPCPVLLRLLPLTPRASSPSPRSQLTPQLERSVWLPQLMLTRWSLVQQPSPTAPPALPWPRLLLLTQHRIVAWKSEHLPVSQVTLTVAPTATAPWPPLHHLVCRRRTGSTTHQKTWWLHTALWPPVAPLQSTSSMAAWISPLGPLLIPALFTPRTMMDTTPLCTWTQACARAVTVAGTGWQLAGPPDTACTSAARWPIRRTLEACTVTARYHAASPYANPRSLPCHQLARILSDASQLQKCPPEALAPSTVLTGKGVRHLMKL